MLYSILTIKPMRHAIITSLFLFLITLAFGQQTEKAFTYFDYGKYTLTKQSITTLDNILDKVKSKDIIHVELYGHTDHVGNDNYNKKLSQDRATAVQQYLVSKGISTDKIKIEYFGEAQPMATNDNENGRQKNRRVEIAIHYKDKVEVAQITKPEIKEAVVVEPSVSKVEVAQIVTPEIKEAVVIKDSISNVSQQPFSVNREYIQTFKFSPNKKIVIKGKKGTIIRIPQNAFCFNNGVAVTSEITIELIEVYTKSDMILNNIQTTSNQQLLETAGMIYIKAFSQNMELTLGERKPLTIEFPTKQHKRDDMNVFYGDTTSQNIDWHKADGNFRFGGDSLYMKNQKTLNKYIFNSTRLGWINCDRFVNEKPLTDLIVMSTDIIDGNFYLVFRSINAVMNASIDHTGIKFANIPVGRKATLIAFKKTDDGMFYSENTIIIQENQSIEITLEKVTNKEFKDRIKKLD